MSLYFYAHTTPDGQHCVIYATPGVDANYTVYEICRSREQAQAEADRLNEMADGGKD